jgi:large subunit ribosomal protein L15
MTSKKKRQRGSKTHGGGSMKKRRGSGHSGGRGNAGSGKRGDSKKPSYWKDKRDKGFTSRQQKKGKGTPINIAALNEKLDTLVDEGKVEKDGDTYVVDLSAIGYAKLLGAGEPRVTYEITAEDASDSAVAKIEDAGGSVETV